MRHVSSLILVGGGLLAFGAAFANMSLLLRTGTSVSHLTGDISRLSLDLARMSPEFLGDLARVGCAAAFFWFGALVSGFCIHHPSLDFTRPYGRTVSGIGIAFLLGSFLVSRNSVAAISLSALGCGLQNALATRYRGIVLRTTHLTGLITDLGTNLGMRWKGLEIPAWKIAVPAILIGCFVAGGMCASFIELRYHCNALGIAGIAYLTAGIMWSILKRRFPQLLSSGGVES